MMPPEWFDKSYVYKGTMPIKSGYSTKILVHKEGIMTNEELAKVINNKVDKIENRFQMRMICLLFLEIFGFILIGYSASYLKSDISFMIGFIIGMALLLFFGIWISQTQKHQKNMRDYIWNLVREDERKRCRMERYEHEGNK